MILRESRTWVRLAAKLFGSSVIAQIAVLGATAVAARRLGPSDFAVLGVVTGGAWFLSTFNTWSADTRISAVPEDESGALFVAGRGVAYLLLLATTVVGAVGWSTGADWVFAVVVTGVSGWVLGLQLIYTAVILRLQSQVTLATSRLVQGLSNAALLLLLLLTPLDGGVTLCMSWWISIVAGLLVIWHRARPHTPRRMLPTRSECRLLVRQVRWQPLASALAGSVGSMPLVLLPALGGANAAGLWAVSSRFLNPAVNTAYNTLQPIFYGRASRHAREGDVAGLRRYHLIWAQVLAVAAIPVFGLFWLVVAVGLPLLGSQWRPVATIAVASAVYFAAHFATLPMQHLLLLTHHLTAQFVWTAVRFVGALLPFALLWTGAVDDVTALNLYILSTVLTQLLQVVLQRVVITDDG